MDECLKEMQRGFGKLFKMHEKVTMDLEDRVKQVDVEEMLELKADKQHLSIHLSQKSNK